MKRFFTALLIIIPVILIPFTIQETLQQIKSVQTEIEGNQKLIEKDINNLKKTNPLFFEQGQFESTSEYKIRLDKGQAIIENIRKQYIGDLFNKINKLRNNIFITENIEVILKKYDPDKQLYYIEIHHEEYQKEIYDVEMNINRKQAEILYENRNKITANGLLSIGIADGICLAAVEISEPMSEFKSRFEFQQVMIKNLGDNIYFVRSAKFSPDGKYLAIGTHSKRMKNNVFLYNLSTNEEESILMNRGDTKNVYFSDNSSYVIAGDINFMIYNLETKIFYENVKKTNKSFYSKDGDYICSLGEANSSGLENLYEFDITRSNQLKINRKFTIEIEDSIINNTLTKPPKLNASIIFFEPSNNQFLDALEQGQIKLTVTNSGMGSAKNISINFKPERIKGLNFNNFYLEEIPAGESETVSIPIEAYIDVKDETHILKIEFDELNGFPPNPIELQFSTKSYEKPEMYIADVGIQDDNNNGKIESGEMIALTIRIANKGKGLASSAFSQFYAGNDVFITESFSKTVSLGDLDYGDYKDVDIEFFVNSRTSEEIPLFVKLTEATGLATVDNLRIPIKKSDKARQIQKTIITGIEREYYELNIGDDLTIDIEQNIPHISKQYKNRIAVIFGIEDYKNVSDVTFAQRDANFIKEYFNKTLGIKENNIYFRTNADVTKAEFDKVFSNGGWLDKRVKSSETEIYFYYAGHGAPEIKENAAYLIPYDGDPNYALQTGYKLDNIYDNLAKMNAKSVTVFLDACFSGANRENEMLLADARPLMMEVNSPVANGITVFSATSSNQISSAWAQQKHGLFSYFLMKGTQGEADANKDKKLSIIELGDYLELKVSEQAGYLDREQTPQLITDDENRILINY